MLSLDAIAERRIREAQERGEIEQLLRQVENDSERAGLLSRIRFLLGRSAAGRRHGDLRVEAAYLERVAECLESRRNA